MPPARGNESSLRWIVRREPDIRLWRASQRAVHQKTEIYGYRQLPDVIYMAGGRSSTLHTKKLVKDLAPLREARSGFSEAALAPQAAGYLAESGITLTHVLFANQKLLRIWASNPKTYEARRWCRRSGAADAILMGAQDDWVMQSCSKSMIVGRMLGDAYVDKLIEVRQFTDTFVNTPYKQLYTDGG